MKQKNRKQGKHLAGEASRLSKSKTVTWWWAVSVLAAGLIFGLGGLLLLRNLAHIIMILILGVSIANALEPVVKWFVDHLPISRTIAILLVYLILALIFAGILWIVVPVFVQQVSDLIDQIQVWAPQAAEWFSGFGIDAENVIGTVSSFTSSISGALLMIPESIVTFIFEFVLILFISIYWLVLFKDIRSFFLSFFPEERKPRVKEILSEMGSATGGYLRGSAIDGVIYGLVTYIGLLIIGVPYALTLGVLAGVLEFFPTIGPIVSGALATLAALTVSPTLALITLVFTIVLQQLENNLLIPLVMKSQTHISPLSSVLAIVAFGTLGGLLGAIVGIPIVSALKVLVNMVIAPALRRLNGVETETNNDEAAQVEEDQE